MVLEKNRLNMYLTRIENAINKILEYTKNINVETLEKHPMAFDSSLMQLIHIGEVANKINKKYPEFKEIPIKKIIGLRNFAAHDYLGVNANIVKYVIKNDLPQIRKLILEYKK